MLQRSNFFVFVCTGLEVAGPSRAEEEGQSLRVSLWFGCLRPQVESSLGRAFRVTLLLHFVVDLEGWKGGGTVGR